MTRTQYINENRAYLGNAVDLLEAITDEQFQMLCAATAGMGNVDPGLDNSLAKTNETIEDFESSRQSHWSECRSSEIVDGIAYYEGVQITKGAERFDMAVVDLGDFRVVLK